MLVCKECGDHIERGEEHGCSECDDVYCKDCMAVKVVCPCQY